MASSDNSNLDSGVAPTTTKPRARRFGKGDQAANSKDKKKFPINGITNAAISRMARRGGVKRMAKTVYTEVMSGGSVFFVLVLLSHPVVSHHHHPRRSAP